MSQASNDVDGPLDTQEFMNVSKVLEESEHLHEVICTPHYMYIRHQVMRL